MQNTYLNFLRGTFLSCVVATLLVSSCTVKNDVVVARDAASDLGDGGVNPTPAIGCIQDDECSTGHCWNGICCTTACSSGCETCNLPGQEGICAPVPEGNAPGRASDCERSNVGSCGQDGTCNGQGECRKYPDNTPCGQGACTGAQVVGAKQCKGGACVVSPDQTCAPFRCDAITSSCLTECINDTQCAPGRSCENGSCGKKPVGLACKANSECDSNTCADGVCCNTACNGACVTCSDPTALGQCVPAKKGVDDPHKLCAKTDVPTCGFSGQCNGLGSCARYEAGTVCVAGSCAGGSFMPSAVCNTQGSCVLGAAITCAPFSCENNACRTECTTNSHCVAPATCNNGSCGKRGVGQACSGAAQCGSGFCTDGVCCEEPCDGKCKSCALAASLGRCLNVPAHTPDPRFMAGERDPTKVCTDKGKSSCSTNGMCDGAGGCEIFASGTVCKPGTCDAVSNSATPQSACDGAGKCLSSAPLACVPFRCSGNRCADVCGSDADCAAPGVCRNGSCGKKGNGQICSNAVECASGTCAQGVCCSTDCSKGCFSCALPGKEGSCSAVPNGAVDPKGMCSDKGAKECGTDGTCNGSGNCRLYSDATICKQSNCAGGQTQATSYCSGSGICIAGTTRDCSPYQCNATATACIDSCSTNTECSAGNVCTNGRCGTKGLGATCTAASDCASGFCVDGLCCEEACAGTCRACNLPGAAGTCANVPVGNTDLGGNCAATAASQCGNSGVCDGNGGCSKWGASTICSAASCPVGGSSLKNPGFCTGMGNCLEGSEQPCGSFLCNSSSATCKTTCRPATASMDCKAGVPCSAVGNTFSCGLKPQGAGCAASSECGAGLSCVDGTCCGSASCDTCQSCKNAAGTCQNVLDGGQDLDSCTSDAVTCGLVGTCNGAGMCKRAAAGTLCGATACTADGNSEVRQDCDGLGVCKPTARLCPNNLKCVSGACKTRCDADSDCRTGKCPGKSRMCK